MDSKPFHAGTDAMLGLPQPLIALSECREDSRLDVLTRQMVRLQQQYAQLSHLIAWQALPWYRRLWWWVRGRAPQFPPFFVES